MTILVTGGAGYMVHALADAGEPAVVHRFPVSDSLPLVYYRNNTMNTCALLDAAKDAGVEQFIFSSTAAIYGNPLQVPVREDALSAPISPYGSSKLTSEVMLHDASKVYGTRFVVLRYFNVAGADPKQRTGQSTPAATHLIKVACEAALGSGQSSKCSAPTIRHRTGPASATTSMSAILHARIRRRSPICAVPG